MVTAIMTSTVILISLAWNDVIQNVIERYYPHKNIDTLNGKITYAIIITIFVVLLQIYVFPRLENYAHS